MQFLEEHDSDDGELVITFFNVVTNGADEESTRVTDKRVAITRDCQEAHEHLVCDYFSDSCIYNEETC